MPLERGNSNFKHYIYGESRYRTEKRFSLSLLSFYAESDFVNNLYQCLFISMFYYLVFGLKNPPQLFDHLPNFEAVHHHWNLCTHLKLTTAK